MKEVLCPEERLTTGERQRLFESSSFSACDLRPEPRELVSAAAGVPNCAGFFDQAVGKQPFDDAVKSACTEPDGSVGEPLDLFHDRVAVRGAVRKCNEHMK